MPVVPAREQYREQGSARSAARRGGDRVTPPPETARPPVPARGIPDLRNNCPLCGRPYESGEQVAALACVSFAPGGGPPWPTPDGDRADTIPLGHQGCVLPRLLTLLAGFRPEQRFENASAEYLALSVAPVR